MEWHNEMADCVNVDPSNAFDYNFLASGIRTVQALRLRTFIVRHGLLNEFLAEDAQGKR